MATETTNPADDYEALMVANQRALQQQPKEGQADVRGNFDSLEGMGNYGTTFARAFGRGASMGWGEKSKAYKQGRPVEEVFEENRAYSDQNPMTNLAGEMVGGAATMAFGLPKLLGWGAKGATAVSPLLGEMAKKAAVVSAQTNTVAGRVAKTAAEGVAEGITYNLGQDESPITGAIWGGVGGVGGQLVLGEVIPGLWRMATGSKGGPKQQAKISDQAEGLILKRLQLSNPDLADPELAAQLAKIAEDLGPQASMADLDKALMEAGLSSIRTMGDVKNANSFIERMVQRSQGNTEQFKRDMNKVVGDGSFYSPNGIKIKAKEDAAVYSQAFNSITEGSKVRYQPKDVATIVNGSFTKKYKDTVTGQDKFTPVINQSATALATLNTTVDKLIEARRTVPGSKTKLHPNEVVLTPQDLVSLRASIDKLYDDSINVTSDAADKTAAVHLAEVRSNVNLLLDQVPGFRDINSKYKDTFNVVAGHDRGVKWLTSDQVSPGDISTYLSTAPQESVDGFLEGAKYELARRLQLPSGGKKMAKAMAENELLMKKLTAAVGEDTANTILASAKNLSQFTKNDTKMMRRRSSALAGEVKPVAENQGLLMDLGVASAGLFTPKVSSAAGIGATRNLGQRMQGTSARLHEGFTDILGLSGDDLTANLLAMSTGRPRVAGKTRSDQLADIAPAATLASQPREED